MTETKQKLEVIQNAYLILKSDCVQSLDCFKIEIEKYNESAMLLISQNNNELEKRNIELLRLQEEIESKHELYLLIKHFHWFLLLFFF